MDKERAKQIIEILSKNFIDKPALNYSTPFELLVAVILSAQCTDERVNKVTEQLFKKYNTPNSISNMDSALLEKYIFSCGLYKNKAKNIIQASTDIVNKFNGQVPNNLNDLRSLAGVGRKTANVVYSVAFNGNAIAVDTHVYRVANRIGFANANNVLKTELQLMDLIDKKDWSKTHHYLIYLGRKICSARKPLCQNCPIGDLCEKNLKTTQDKNSKTKR